MNGFELSPEATEAMREAGGFRLAGESDAAHFDVTTFSSAAQPENNFILPEDFIEATQLYIGVHEDQQMQDESNSNLSLDEQLSYTSKLMATMGLIAPHHNLSTTDYNQLERTYDNKTRPQHNPFRLVVAPLFPASANLLKSRQQMVRRARDNCPEALFAETGEPLRVPDANMPYGELLQATQDIRDYYADEHIIRGLRYAAGGRLRGRDDYLDYLERKNNVVRGANDTLWSYDFVDTSVGLLRSPTAGTGVQRVHEAASKMPTNSPEREIIIRTQQAIAGTSEINSSRIIVNEAVYEGAYEFGVDKATSLRWATNIFWSKHLKQLFLDNVGTTFNIRESINGLKP